MKLNIIWCPRCHENHGMMEFVQLDNPKGPVDHWVECPVTKHPILTQTSTSVYAPKEPSVITQDGQQHVMTREPQQFTSIALW